MSTVSKAALRLSINRRALTFFFSRLYDLLINMGNTMRCGMTLPKAKLAVIQKFVLSFKFNHPCMNKFFKDFIDLRKY